MLCSANSGKLLSSKYAQDLEACAKNKDNFTAEQQNFLNLPEGMGHGDYKEETMKIDSTPIDPQTPSKKNILDIRKRPET